MVSIAQVTASQAASALRTLVATASVRNRTGTGSGDGDGGEVTGPEAKAEAEAVARRMAKEVGVVRAEVGALLSDLLCRSGGLEAVLDSYVGSLGAATISEDGAVAAVENLSRLLSRTPTSLTSIEYLSLIGKDQRNQRSAPIRTEPTEPTVWSDPTPHASPPDALLFATHARGSPL